MEQKYHIKVSVHPIREDENKEEYIDESVEMMSMITQGEGFHKEYVIEALNKYHNSDEIESETDMSAWSDMGYRTTTREKIVKDFDDELKKQRIKSFATAAIQGILANIEILTELAKLDSEFTKPAAKMSLEVAEHMEKEYQESIKNI